MDIKKFFARLFMFMLIVQIIAVFLATAVLAQGAASPGQDVSLGQYTLPLILMVFLAVVYKIFGEEADKVGVIPNRLKPLISIGLGVGLGIVAMFYAGVPTTFKMIVDYVLYGIMTGCSAAGLWDGISAVRGK